MMSDGNEVTRVSLILRNDESIQYPLRRRTLSRSRKWNKDIPEFCFYAWEFQLEICSFDKKKWAEFSELGSY